MSRKHLVISLVASALSLSVAIPTLAADGDLDTTFGVGGRVTYEALSASAQAIQADGKIVVAASINESPADFMLVRYNRDGSLDSTFGIGGKVTTDFGHDDRAAAVAIQSDGKIVAAGRIVYGFSSDFLLARYNSDGSLDAAFGVGGSVTTDFSGRLDHLSALAIQSDGKIVAAGYVYDDGQPSDFGIVRYNPDGSLDVTFGIDGKIITDFLGFGDRPNALAIQTDGKIVAAGMMTLRPSGTPYSGFLSVRGALVRYSKDGSLDTTFGVGGKVITNILGTSEINTLSIQSDGKIIAAGRSVSLVSPDIFFLGPTGVDFGLIRYNEDGSLDTTFGLQGKVTTDLGSLGDVIYAVSLQPDGKIIAAGQTDSSGYWPTPKFALARYNRDGSLDATFGVEGIVRAASTDNRTQSTCCLSIQPDGKIVVAGNVRTFDECGYETSAFFEVARYDTSGLQIVTAVNADPAVIAVGAAWEVTLAGSNLTDETYFDVRFRSPGSTTDQVVLNWQQGTSAHHPIPAGTQAGIWTVNGIRAHENLSDHAGEFVAISAAVTVQK